jgi:hypothetical protein
MNSDMENAAVELDKWLRFAGGQMNGFISVAVTSDALLVYYDKTYPEPLGMPESFSHFPVKMKRIGRPMPATA